MSRATIGLALLVAATLLLAPALAYGIPYTYDEDAEGGIHSYSRVRGLVEHYTCNNRANYTVINTEDETPVTIYGHAEYESGGEYIQYIRRLTGFLSYMKYTINGNGCILDARAFATVSSVWGPIDSDASIRVIANP